MIIIYDSKTGNTEKVATLILNGVRSSGVSVEMKKVDSIKNGDLASAKGLIIGSYCIRDNCSMRIDELLKSIEPAAVDKKPGAAFGSYKFSGGHLQKLEADMVKLGIRLVTPGVNVIKEPDEQASLKLAELGKEVGEAVKDT